MLPKFAIPMFISSLVLVAWFCLDTSSGNPVAGNLAVSFLLGVFATVVMVMPFYGMATLFRRLLNWPEWTRIVIVAALWVALWEFLFLKLPPEESGLHSQTDVFHAASQFWFVSLAYGVPAVITNNRVNSRRGAEEQELLRLEASARPPHNPENF